MAKNVSFDTLVERPEAPVQWCECPSSDISILASGHTCQHFIIISEINEKQFWGQGTVYYWQTRKDAFTGSNDNSPKGESGHFDKLYIGSCIVHMSWRRNTAVRTKNDHPIEHLNKYIYNYWSWFRGKTVKGELELFQNAMQNKKL